MTLIDTAHLSEDELNLHVLGDLPPRRNRRAEKHLGSCTHCRHRFNSMASFISLFKAAAKVTAGMREQAT